MKKQKEAIVKLLSYVLVAALASAVTFFICGRGTSKLTALQTLLEDKFIGEVDTGALEDAAAAAMVNALGDRWSYYIPAEDYASFQEQNQNAYVGIGVTIEYRKDGQGADILQVEPGGSALEAGILPGDILVEVDGKSVLELNGSQVRDLIRGEEGTSVRVAVLRDGQRLEFAPTRKTIQVQVVTFQMLPDRVGLIKINNFNDRCAQEAKQAIDQLIEQGAEALIFDVRNNPGGYVNQMTDLLDYLLPEGRLFYSVDYAGREQKIDSDAHAIRLPMAVLVNGESYSAAEFFAAALSEYDWAVVAGEATCGKGYFQTSFRFRDGSAVGLSVGKYFTPKGVSLADTKGLVPEVLVEADEKTAAMIYAGTLAPEDDPQLQAAIRALQ
ncbi:MAG: PDZ domain-containing protein [Oscillospiraceae bacterium]|nr:PDZ domain-containing protein [Oscillospiraceae bacterium]